ncbi:hypothetical protein ACJMK2_016001 [Sinanodonta woodiana]|uniref:Chromosomal protein D1-like n=1 Tax=Sinanodonta woodiana TaxID=1069815 RepID=A0ABD3UUA0_SINWO
MTSKLKLQEENADSPPEENGDNSSSAEENTDSTPTKSPSPVGEKRGRGRPALPPEARRVYISTGRPRGRPRVKPLYVPSGKPRGRPRVKPLPDPTAPKRPRGRPRVYGTMGKRPRGRPRVFAPMRDPNAPKRPRGRPRVHRLEQKNADNSPLDPNAPKRPRGRPRVYTSTVKNRKRVETKLEENTDNSTHHGEDKTPVKMTVDVDRPQQFQSIKKKQVYISTGRPRGRPRVKPLPDPNAPKRPRGRPRVKAPKMRNEKMFSVKITSRGDIRRSRGRPPKKVQEKNATESID